MSSPEALMGVGVPPSQAVRLGYRALALTAVGVAQGGAPIVMGRGENVAVNLTTAGGQTAMTLPANVETGDIVVVNVLTATAGLVFPSTGQTISNKAANASVTVAIGALFMKTGALTWASVGAA